MIRTRSARPEQGPGARNIFPGMRIGALVALLCVAACRARPQETTALHSDPVDLPQLLPHDSTDGTLLIPRVVTEPSVGRFWLRAAATLAADARADRFNDLSDSTDQNAPTPA